MRVTELWIPPRTPVISLPGVLMIFSCAWYISTMPGLTRWLTTARTATAPLRLNISIQSLSSIPARLASSSLIHATGPPRLSVSINRLSVYVLWMPHF
ncbi:hypothetical protein D3C72_2145240 [compost metagenome]